VQRLQAKEEYLAGEKISFRKETERLVEFKLFNLLGLDVG